MRRTGMCVAMFLAFVTLWAAAAPAADRSPQGGVPQGTQSPRGGVSQGTQVQQRTPQSAADMNRIPVRVQPRTTQSKLAAALAAVEKSEQGLKAAVAAMTAYLDREAACAGKSWTAQEMEKGCLLQDTLKLCKEKLVAACAVAQGPGKGKLWSDVQGAAADLGKKAQAVSDVYGGPSMINIPGTPGGPPVVPPLF